MMELTPSEFSCGGDDGTTPYQPKYSGETVPWARRWWEHLTPLPRIEPESDEHRNHVDSTRSPPTTTRRPWYPSSTRRPSYQTSTPRRPDFPSWTSTTTSSYTTTERDGEFSFSGEGEERGEEVESSFYQEEFINSGEFYVTKPVNDHPSVEDFIDVKTSDHDEAHAHNALESIHDEMEKSSNVAATTPNPDELSNSLFSLSADAPYGQNKLECFFHPTTLSANTRDNVK
jgi:hypothetical protein